MVIFYIITDSLFIFTEIMLFGDLIADFRSDSFTKRIAGYLIVIEYLVLESTIQVRTYLYRLFPWLSNIDQERII
jgi:hypothetical protein